MTNNELTTEDAQEIAQLLVDYDAAVAGEWGADRELGALENAKLLYDTFGPFDLEFKDWVITQPPRWWLEAEVYE